MTYRLDALTERDCEEARTWRNRDDVRLGLRTPYMLTAEMQAAFYRDVVCNRDARSRFWAVRREGYGDLSAMVGLTSIEWENGTAEISLLVNPNSQGAGVGAEAVRLVLAEAFRRLRLVTVTGECYEHNQAVGFWRRELGWWSPSGSVVLPRRKFWDGQFHAALYFWFGAPSPAVEQAVEQAA